MHWLRKFGYAFRGLLVGVRGQSSFLVHLPVAAGVLAWAAYRELDSVRWLLLVLCIGVVLAAELFNSALERLAQAITQEHDERIRDALDSSSAAVLVVSLAAAVVGVVILVLPA